jgi:hypothetical protein
MIQKATFSSGKKNSFVQLGFFLWVTDKKSWGRIFSHVWPFYERAVSDLDP